MDSLAEKIIVENKDNKKINGHKPEYVASRMGISKEELFPVGKRTLYIGDPWQVLDLPGVTIIDYEYGPIVEFNETKAELLSKLDDDYYRAYNDWGDSNEYDQVFYKGFLDDNYIRVTDLVNRTKAASVEELPGIAKEYDQLKKDVEIELGKYGDDLDGEEMSDEQERIRSLWYLAVEGGRSRDVYDYKYLLGDKFKEYSNSLPVSLSQEQRHRLESEKKKELIESIRLRKTARESDVVQAMFPYLPFGNESFDSLVAFYSISTYVFSALMKDDFEKYWSEIDRVLKEGGKAYIGPIWTRNVDDFQESLKEYASKHPWFSYTKNDSPMVKPIYGQSILTISKQQYDQRVENPEEIEPPMRLGNTRLRHVNQRDLEN